MNKRKRREEKKREIGGEREREGNEGVREEGRGVDGDEGRRAGREKLKYWRED